METDFSAFFLLVETIIRIRLNSVFKKYSWKGKRMVGEKIFPANRNHSPPPIFQRLLSVFFRLVEKYFSTKLFIPAGGNGFSS